MYQPKHFEQTDPAALAALMGEHPFATLVSTQEGGVTADHLPLQFVPGVGEHGVLRGHVARANPLWQRCGGQPVLAIFQGVQAYISPSWYPSKAQHGKVVPTWNYAVVHAHGALQVHDDAAWLLAFVSSLTTTHEAGRRHPWAVTDAPGDYIEQMLKAIVGIEIPVARLEGKWKLSQNRGAAEREGVARGLAAEAAEPPRAMAPKVFSPPA